MEKRDGVKKNKRQAGKETEGEKGANGGSQGREERDL